MTLGYYRGVINILAGMWYVWYNGGLVFPKEDNRIRVLLIRMFFAGLAINLKFTGAKINSLQKFIVIIRTESIQT